MACSDSDSLPSAHCGRDFRGIYGFVRLTVSRRGTRLTRTSSLSSRRDGYALAYPKDGCRRRVPPTSMQSVRGLRDYRCRRGQASKLRA